MPQSSASPLDPSSIRAVLLDIEGTTTPAEFVYKVLFPFARARLRGFLETHARDAGVRAEIEALRREHATEKEPAGQAALDNEAPSLPPWDDSPERAAEWAATYALWLMDRDRKSTALKSLQGRIWEAGYRSGELRGQVYPDVPPALARWKQQGRRIAIFSSGSVQAQQLLFCYSTAGDLTPFLDAYFDTTTGPKQEPESYARIAARLQLPPQSILFVSDVAGELEAARAAGMHTLLAVRSKPKPPCESSHRVIHTFDSILSD